MPLQAYQGWAATKANGRNRQYAATMYINNATMEMVQGMREQLLGELQVPRRWPSVIARLSQWNPLNLNFSLF